MSVRVYQLAKQLGIENNEVIVLLRERGLAVDGPSNSIPNIYADALIEEIGVKKVKPEAKITEVPVAMSLVEVVSEDNTKTSVENKIDDLPSEALKSVFKKPAINKSFEDVIAEKKLERSKFEDKNAVRKDQNLKPSVTDVSEKKIEKQVPQVQVEKTSFKPKSASYPVRRDTRQGHGPDKKNFDKAPRRDDESVRVEEFIVTAPKIEFSKFARTIDRPTAKFDNLKKIEVKQPIVVKDLATALGIKPFQLISKLMSMDVFASMNKSVDPVVAQAVAEKFGFELEIKHRGEKEIKKPVITKKLVVENNEDGVLEARSPIVCVLGHVDHGKTTLLDTIRKTNVVAGEAGGITQKVAAYQVEKNGSKITFIDTPGHAAFSKMRERGANITDIGVLVVAADDGFMPQTDEALKFAKNANIPVVVAINKMDSKGANIDRVKQQMQQRGIAPEDWGGETLCCPVSALKGENIDALLEFILLQAEMLELRASKDGTVRGVVLESQVDVGLGATVSAIIQNGTLKIGNFLVCGDSICKVRSIIDDNGKQVKQALPSAPIKIIGWEKPPFIGDSFYSVASDKNARSEAEKNALIIKDKSAANEEVVVKAMNLNDLFAAIESSNDKVLKIILRADVQGSLEALRGCLESIKSTKIKLEIVGEGIGLISKNDILSADASGATIVAFNTKFDTGVQAVAKHYNTRVIQNNIIYESIDQVRDAMTDLLDPELKENKLGVAEIRQIFAVKHDIIYGCMVTEGKILRDQFVRVLRNKEIIFQGKFSSLKRMKDDVGEVRAGFECGIKVAGFEKCQVGDLLECFTIIKIKPSL